MEKFAPTKKLHTVIIYKLDNLLLTLQRKYQQWKRDYFLFLNLLN